MPGRQHIRVRPASLSPFGQSTERAVAKRRMAESTSRSATTADKRRRASSLGPIRYTRRRLLATMLPTLGVLSLLAACSDFGGGSGSTQASEATATAQTTATMSESVTTTSTATAASVLQQVRRRSPKSKRANVILITIDTLRADQLLPYTASSKVSTPVLNSLAKQSVRFDWHMVHQPQTVPSHGSILTAMYPTSNGLRRQMTDTLPNDIETAGTVFMQHGYHTAALFSCAALAQRHTNFQPGFHSYVDLTANLHPNPPGAMLKSTADRTTRAAISELQVLSREPFFMWLHYIDPHCPYVPPAPYDDRYDPEYKGSLNGGWGTVVGILSGKIHPRGPDLDHLKALYQGEISYVDGQLQLLLSAIERLGLTYNTALAITSDHGESFAEHKDFFTSEGIYHPFSLYNSETHVPFYLHFPGTLPQDKSVPYPTGSVDVLPTLLDLAGLPPLAQAQGASLLPLIDGKAPSETPFVYAAMDNTVFTSVTTTGWKLIRNNATRQFHLFDLKTDPNEVTDVQHSNTAIFNALSSQLTSWMVSQRLL